MADPIIGQISVGDGATFTPSVDNAGVLSWSNNKNLTNPASVDLAQAVLDKGLLAPIASPAFTGTPTAPTPTAGDDSTNIATTAFVQAELDDYLALAGGTMTGNIVLSSGAMVSNHDNTTAIRFVGGDATNGYTGNARIALFGNNYSYSPSLAGAFAFVADDSANNCTLYGYPNGDLKWGSKEVERVQASGTNYIRFVSGVQICWGKVTSFTNGVGQVTFPVAFKDDSWSISLCGMPAGEGVGAGRLTSVNTNTKSATGVKCTILSYSNGAVSTHLCWFAVGYWQ